MQPPIALDRKGGAAPGHPADLDYTACRAISVMQQAAPIGMPRIAFSTTSLAPALKHYQVRGPSGVIGDGKLTILR